MSDIYLDHAAATPILESVLKRLSTSLKIDWANSSSKHAYGKQVYSKLTKVRDTFAKELSCSSEQIFFLSSVTEANNLFIKGQEAPSNIHYYFSMADHSSISKVIPAFSGNYSLLNFTDKFDFNLSEHTFDQEKQNVFLFSAVNSQSGLKFDLAILIEQIRQACPNAIVGTDASQYFARQGIDLRALDIDFFSFSSHKLGGPKGIAGCYFKNPDSVVPLLHGGGHEGRVRSSTVAVPLILGFEETLLYWKTERERAARKFSSLEEQLVSGLCGKIEEAYFPFRNFSHSSHILMGVFPAVASDVLMRHLEMEKIIVASASACSSKNKSSNSILEALKIAPEHMKNILRFSFAPSTTSEEVEQFVEAFTKQYCSLRRISNYKR